MINRLNKVGLLSHIFNMKFLIVNGFNATPANHKIFEQFKSLIYEVKNSLLLDHSIIKRNG